MNNPTAEDVLKKAFDHLDEILGEGSKDSGGEVEKHPDTPKEEKHDEETKQEITEYER